MSSGIKCKNCGSTDIEEDNARGDAVCTNCGSVLEDNIIVSEVQFEEIGHSATTIGQFVSADSSGGTLSFGGYGKFQVGSGTESREVTIKKAKTGISHLCHQLQLTQHYIDTAVNFFKMALMRHLTRGRRNTHIYAACVYITCRTEGTSHLLIDISDILQICCYELGRAYLKLSQSLCINIPSIDPCLYIMRFANKLEFGAKTHEVSMTALRIVQRMKKDSIHSGRRPTGLCGAALLIAARIHEFSRTIMDVVRIVKIHESTVRKRLTEFYETPSSLLTLDEFMAVDLEAEQDPPAFKASRKKDRERIQKVADIELTELQLEIDSILETKKPVKRKATMYMSDAEGIAVNSFIEESSQAALNECLVDDPTAIIDPDAVHFATPAPKPYPQGLKPDIAAMCIPPIVNLKTDLDATANPADEDGDAFDLEGIDDDEINGYIMTEQEALFKNEMWMKLNAEYLEEVRIREEKLAKEREEGKPEKKKRRNRKKGLIGPSNTAGEAIEKMLQEKKISSKINYDILKSLTESKIGVTDGPDPVIKEDDFESIDQKPFMKIETETKPLISNLDRKVKPALASLSIGIESKNEISKNEPVVENDDIYEEDELEAAEPEPEPEPEHSSLKDMLNQPGDDDEYYGFDDENY